jgi:hypothetical protein
MRRAAHADHDRIRALFLHREESYTLANAARLLGVASSTVRREAEADDREAYRANGAWRFSWRQLAHLALRRWSLAQLHDALGSDATDVLPPLLTLQPLTVELPAYLVRAIEQAATEEQTSIDDWLHLELIDFASGMVHRMERILPGFQRAYLFPGRE